MYARPVDSDRYDRGWERLRELAGEQGERVIEGVRDVAPDLARYVVEFGYGDVYSRPGLDDRSRQLAAISITNAHEAIEQAGLSGGWLGQIAEWILHRRN